MRPMPDTEVETLSEEAWKNLHQLQRVDVVKTQKVEAPSL